MDFFSRLRQLSLAVERDVADIQQTFDLPRSEDDSTDGAALLLLQEIKNDVIGVKESAQHSFRRLCEVPEFVEVVNAACALVERERVLLAETEEHLQQYGYTPVLTPGVEREGGGGGANGELGATSQDTEDSSPVKCESQPSPASSGDSPIAPVLHSFAFAKNFSSRYKSANGGQVPRMYSDQTVETSRKVAQQDISIGTNKFDGIDTDSPIPPVLQTPGIKNIGQVKSKTVIQGNANGIVSDDNSPVPPIMQTPGFNQIRKMDRNGITDESSFQCPVGPVISGHVIKGGALADDSPLPPVMQTPGVKQLNRFVDKNGDNVDLPAEPQLDTPEPPEMTVQYKVAVDGKALPAKPTLSSRFDLMNTPEPPKMTFNYKDYVKLMASRQPQSQTTGLSHKPGQHKTAGASHVPNPSATTTSMYSPWTQSHGGAIAVVTPICHHTQSQNMTAVEPSLAAQYQRAMTEDLGFETPRTKEPTSFSNGFLISRGLVEDEDEDFPEPPERTVKLQDLVNLGILAPDGTRETVGSTTNAPRGAGAPLSTTSAPLRVSGIPLRSTKASTTTALVHHPHPCNSPPSSQVAEVSEDEYKYLPNYVTRSLPLERFNTAVRSINEILTDTSGDQRVRESCLHPILGSHHTKPFFLAMLSLGRLHCDSDHMCGEPVYVLADL